MIDPVLWLVAGANGVGKTTYARRYIEQVSGSRAFVNLDEIARGLSPLDPEAERIRAARVALDLLRDTLAVRNGRRNSVTLETTLAGLTHLRTIAMARSEGWRVHLLYFAVKSPSLALQRIARRVSEGGHDIPEADARRRFERSLANFTRYAARCDLWRIFDNNAATPVAVAEGAGSCRNFLTPDIGGLPDRLQDAVRALPECRGS